MKSLQPARQLILGVRQDDLIADSYKPRGSIPSCFLALVESERRKMHSCFRIALLPLAVGWIGFSSAPTVLAVPKPSDANAVSPFDKLDREQMTPIEKAHLPDIAVGVVTVNSGTVLSCAFSEDGKLALGTDQGEVVLWDLTGAAPKEIGKLQRAKVKGRVERLAFAGDGKRLAVSLAGTLQVWDITEKGGTLFDTKLVGRIEGLAFSPDGKLIACGANLGLLFAVQAEGIAPLPGQFQGAQGSYTFSTDGGLFASVFFTPERNGNLYGSEVKFWKMERNKPLEYSMVQLDSSIKSIALSSDSKMLASGSLDNVVRIWDIGGKNPEVKVKMNSPKWIRSLSFTPDGAYLVGFSSGADIVLYDVAKGEKHKAWAFVPHRNSDFATGAMYRVFSASSMAPDGKHIAFSNHTAKTVIMRLPIKDEGKKDAPKK
jgi:WD40 repeat protein